MLLWFINCVPSASVIFVANSYIIKIFIVYWLIAGGVAPLEKLTVPQLVTSFAEFYGNRWFVTVFSITRHFCPSWARSIESKPFFSTSLRSILIVLSYTCLALPSDLFPSGFPHQNLVCISFLSVRAVYLTHLILLTWSSKQYLAKRTNRKLFIVFFLRHTCLGTAL